MAGDFLNSLLRQSDRVRVACLAQIVNVIAALMTNETGVLRQSIYYPYAWVLLHARGRLLDLRLESETYPIVADGLRADFARNDQIPFLDVTATHDPSNGQVYVLVLNRDLKSERELVLEWRDPTPTKILFCETLTGPDLKASNTFAQPLAIAPRPLATPQPSSRMTFKLPARSYIILVMAAA